MHADENHVESGEILASADGGSVPRDRGRLRVGREQRPGLHLKAVQDGKEYSLSQFKGKVVLINFFTFFCGPCRQEMPHLSQMGQELKGQGFQTLGIGLSSTPEQLKQIVTQLGLAYPVLQGNDAVSKAYGGVELVPLTFIIDKQGNIAHKILGARSKEEFEKMIKPLL